MGTLLEYLSFMVKIDCSRRRLERASRRNIATAFLAGSSLSVLITLLGKPAFAMDAFVGSSVPAFTTLGWYNPVGELLAMFAGLCGIGVLLCLAVGDSVVPQITAWVCSLASVFALSLGINALLYGRSLHFSLWVLPGVDALSLGIDRLSALFIVFAGLVSLATSVFSSAYMKCYIGRQSFKPFGVFYHVLIASIVFVLMADDVVTFAVAWELMAIASYVLVAFACQAEEAGQAGFLMLAMGESGLLMVLVAFLVIAAHTNSLTFDALRQAASRLSEGERLGVFLLSLFGFGIKVGFVPLNSWFPRAYAAAPANVCALLSGATVNLGIYALLRITADLAFAPSVAYGVILMTIGGITALVGILYASTADDLKKVLAYSSIENIGITATAFGAAFVFIGYSASTAASIAFAAGLYQLFNHSIYKALLFLGVGSVETGTGSRRLNQLGGLIRSMPWTAAAFLVGALSIAGMPPLNGFASEWLTLETLLLSSSLPHQRVKIVFAVCGVALALSLGLAVTCFVRAFAMGFLGMARSSKAIGANEVPITMRIAQVALALLCFVLGVAPTYVISVLNLAVEPITGASATQALVPPFFTPHSAHPSLPAQFVTEFHALGAQLGQGLLPGRGLVVLYRGAAHNPVVFAMATSYMAVVLALMVLVAYGVFRLLIAYRRRAVRGAVWAGGLERLLPEMTYTATGFSNPVRVIFTAIFKPTTVEDIRETIGKHFREAIRRTQEDDYVLDRIVLKPVAKTALWVANTLARMHHGYLNAYVLYGLAALLALLFAGILS